MAKLLLLSEPNGAMKKRKSCNYLSEQADVVVRYQGR